MSLAADDERAFHVLMQHPNVRFATACFHGQQAVEKAGLDRKALREHIAKNEFKTILGGIRFQGSENASIPGTVSQWQGNDFEVLWPKDRATAQLNTNKPAWK